MQIDRLVELFIAYNDRVKAVEAGLGVTQRELLRDGFSEEEVKV